MGNKHTPGPWHVGTKYPCRVISDTDKSIPAFCCLPDDEGSESDREKANARLIAAAPELLERAKALVSEVTAIARGEFGSDWADTYGPLFEILTRLKAAIAKAEEQPHADHE